MTKQEPVGAPPPGSPVPDGAADDLRLASAAARGDEFAFELLVRRHLPCSYSVARWVLQDDELAASAVRDAMVTAWRCVGDYDASRATVRTWLLAVVHAEAVERRRARPHPDPRTAAELEPDGDSDRSPSDPLADPTVPQRAPAVRAAISALPDAEREAVLRLYVGGCTTEQAAADGASQAVRVNALAGLRRLQGSLQS